MAQALEIAASFLGLLGSLLLIWSAWRGAPFRSTIDLGNKIDPKGLLAAEAQKDFEAAKCQLADVMSLEPKFLLWGAASLSAGFACSILKFFF